MLLLLLLLFAWAAKTTYNPHVMLRVRPLELRIWTRVCGPLSWGSGAFQPLYIWGEHVARRGGLVIWLDQAAGACSPGPPCLGVLSLVGDTLDLKYCSKLFHQTVHALSARFHKTARYTNASGCVSKIPPSNFSPGNR